MFGESLGTDGPEGLPHSVMPLLKAGTGPIALHYSFSSEKMKWRRSTEDELEWIQLRLPSLAKFVKEERELALQVVERG